MRFTKQKASDAVTSWHVYANGRGVSCHKTKANADKAIRELRKKYEKQGC